MDAKLKPESEKIINIAVDHKDLNQTVSIFGLGTDGILYVWNTKDSNWYRYSQQ